MAAKTYNISENLELLAQNKQAIKNAINTKGGTITDSTPLSEYATQIESLPSGGGSSTDYYVSGTSSANTFTVKVNNTNVTPTFTASGSGYTWKVDLNSYEVADLYQFAIGNNAITSADMSHAGNAVGLTSAFRNCYNLTEYIPNALDACIYGSQFEGSGLRAYTIPSYCAYIGYDAFARCTAMTSVNIPGKAVMGEYCFSQAGLTEATMYNRQYIPVATFQNCKSLATINQNIVNSVGDYAFVDCDGFQPDEYFFGQLEIIGKSAFKGCIALGELILSECYSIGANAFADCTGLNEIRFRDTESGPGHVAIPTLGEGAFDNTNGCAIFVPAGKISEFLAVDGWAAYEDRLQEAGDGIKLLDGNGNEVFAGYTHIPYTELPDKLYVGGDDSWHNLRLKDTYGGDMFFDGSIVDFNDSDTFEKTNIGSTLMGRDIYIVIDDVLQRQIKFIEI